MIIRNAGQSLSHGGRHSNDLSDQTMLQVKQNDNDGIVTWQNNISSWIMP
jgi:hypothetical protein